MTVWAGRERDGPMRHARQGACGTDPGNENLEEPSTSPTQHPIRITYLHSPSPGDTFHDNTSLRSFETAPQAATQSYGEIQIIHPRFALPQNFRYTTNGCARSPSAKSGKEKPALEKKSTFPRPFVLLTFLPKRGIENVD